MNIGRTYWKIEKIMKRYGLPLAPHEFSNVATFEEIGMTESALGRRLREMRERGMVTSRTRAGKTFKEFALAVRVPESEPVCPI